MAATLQYFVDSSGQAWQISINTQGELVATTVATIPPVVSGSFTTTTAQNIIDACAIDAEDIIQNSAVLLEFVNQTHLHLLRQSRWYFLQSGVQTFITRKGVTKYWIGPSGQQPAGALDTGLNIQDLEFLKLNSLYDRTNNRPLGTLEADAIGDSILYKDGSYRLDEPRAYRYNYITDPNLITLYPAPANNNTYQPIPEPALTTTTAGGALANRTYYVKVTFVDSEGGESVSSPETNGVFIAANNLVTVQPPAILFGSNDEGVQYNQYNVYASTTQSAETLQNASPISISSTWTEPNTGLTTNGASAPNSTPSNGIQQMGGYLIQFQYFKKRQAISTPAQTLQVPDDYKDVVVAGVNSRVMRYLKRLPEAQEWERIYREGIIQILRDKHLEPSGNDYIRPDLGGNEGRVQ